MLGAAQSVVLRAAACTATLVAQTHNTSAFKHASSTVRWCRAQLNPRYCEQLRELLRWPQSCGVLGGRPSSSLLFVGAQAGHVLFLDPHEVQEVRARRHPKPYPNPNTLPYINLPKIWCAATILVGACFPVRRIRQT